MHTRMTHWPAPNVHIKQCAHKHVDIIWSQPLGRGDPYFYLCTTQLKGIKSKNKDLGSYAEYDACRIAELQKCTLGWTCRTI